VLAAAFKKGLMLHGAQHSAMHDKQLCWSVCVCGYTATAGQRTNKETLGHAQFAAPSKTCALNNQHQVFNAWVPNILVTQKIGNQTMVVGPNHCAAAEAPMHC